MSFDDDRGLRRRCSGVWGKVGDRVMEFWKGASYSSGGRVK